MFPVGSHEIVWWKCKKCGTSYKKSIRVRSRLKVTCPQCNIKCKSKKYKLYMLDMKTREILKSLFFLVWYIISTIIIIHAFKVKYLNNYTSIYF